MKKTNKHMARIVAVFMSLMLLISSFALPATAALLDNSENDYGISYSDGIYTLNINAGALSALLKKDNINKETLMQILPEKLVNFLTERDAESAMALLKDLYAAADPTQLKNDIPWNVIINEISTDDLLDVIDIDAILDMIDIDVLMNAIADELGGDITSIFKEGKFEEYIATIDITSLFADKVRVEKLIAFLTAEELQAALKKDAIDKLLADDEFVDNVITTLVTPELIEKMLDDTNGDAIITSKELTSLIDTYPAIVDYVVKNFKTIFDSEDIKTIINSTDKETLLNSGALQTIITPDDVIKAIGDDFDASVLMKEEIFKNAIYKDKSVIDAIKVNASDIANNINISVDKLNDYIVDVPATASVTGSTPTVTATDIAELIAEGRLDISKMLADGVIPQNVLTDYITVDIIENLFYEQDGCAEKLVEVLGIDVLTLLDEDDVAYLIDHGYISENTIASLIDIDIINSLIDNEVITNAMIKSLVDSDKISRAIAKGYINATSIIDMVEVSELVSLVDVTALPMDKILAVFPVSEMMDLFLDQNLNGLISSIDINKMVKLNAFKNIITSIEPSELFDAINKDSLKNGLMAKLYSNFLYTTTIDLNGVNIYNGSFDIEAIEYAVLSGIPTPEKLANVANDNVIAEFVLSYTVLNPADPADVTKAASYANGFRIALTGNENDIATIAEYGAKLASIVSVDFDYSGSAIETSFVINAPEKLAELYVRSLNTDRLPASIRAKLFGIGNIVFDDATIDSAVDALFSKLTLEEVRTFLQSVEPNKYSEKILELLDMYSSQANAVLERLISVLDRVIDQATNNSNLKDKTLADVYLGNGRFALNTAFTYTVELPSSIPTEISSLFTNLRIDNNINVDITFNGLHSVKVVNAEGQTVYTAYRTEGDSLSFLFTQDEIAALGVTEWANANNVKIDTATLTMGAEDIIIRPYVEGASIFTANFYVDGKLYYTTTFDPAIPETLNGAFPNVPTKLAYTFTWNWDYPTTLEARDYNIFGTYTAKTYKATFMYDGERWSTLTYTVETINRIKMPDTPVIRYYTTTWDPSYLLLVDSIYNVISTPTAYVINYTDAEGNVLASDVKFTVVDYLNGNIEAPEVSAKEGYTWVWDYSPLKALYEASADSLSCTIAGAYVADSDLKTYTVTFYDFNGNVFTTRTFKEGNTKLTSIPTAPILAGYETSWNWDGTLKNDNISVYPAKKAIEYTATFKDAAGETKVTFTIETIDSVKAPEVAAKEGYTGKWEDYTLTTSNITINAVYTAVEYTVTFVADGDVVGTTKYTVEDKNITEPEVPAKDGFTGAWEDYELNGSDITVNAIYTEVEGGSLLWLWILLGVILCGGIATGVVVVLKKKKII